MRFFPLTLLTLLVFLPSAFASPVVAAKVHTSIPHYKSHEPQHMSDSDDSTFFWSWRNPKRGEWIALDYDQSLKGKNVTVRTGNAKGEDMIHNARVQSSADGKLWRTISLFRNGKAEGTVPNNAKHLRIEFYADAWSWVIVKNVEVGDQALTRSTTQRNVQVDGKKIPLKITIDTENVESSQDIISELTELYFIEWPKIREIIDAPLASTPKHLFLRFENNIGFPAYVAGTNMVISAQHLKKHRADTYGVFTHELTHFVQHYGGKAPTWFSEGTADYVRYQLHKDSLWARQNKRYNKRKNPLGAYWNSTAFLLWLEKTYNKPITALVSRACSERRYTHEIWKEITTKSLEELTKEYEQAP